jgi:hypothetical protein
MVAIVDGEYDDVLDRIEVAINERRKAMREKAARVNMLTITPGTQVRLKGLSPKTLNGLQGEVVMVKGKTFTVRLDRPWGSRNTVRVPAVCVEAA